MGASYLSGKQTLKLPKTKTLMKIEKAEDIAKYMVFRFPDIKDSHLLKDDVANLLSRMLHNKELDNPALGSIADEYRIDVKAALSEETERLQKLSPADILFYAEDTQKALIAFHVSEDSSVAPPATEVYDLEEQSSLIKSLMEEAPVVRWAKPGENMPLAELEAKSPKAPPPTQIVQGVKLFLKAVLATNELERRSGKDKAVFTEEKIREMHMHDLFPGRGTFPAVKSQLEKALADYKRNGK